jgi:hypothetical protein
MEISWLCSEWKESLSFRTPRFGVRNLMDRNSRFLVPIILQKIQHGGCTKRNNIGTRNGMSLLYQIPRLPRWGSARNGNFLVVLEMEKSVIPSPLSGRACLPCLRQVNRQAGNLKESNSRFLACPFGATLGMEISWLCSEWKCTVYARNGRSHCHSEPRGLG